RAPTARRSGRPAPSLACAASYPPSGVSRTYPQGLPFGSTAKPTTATASTSGACRSQLVNPTTGVLPLTSLPLPRCPVESLAVSSFTSRPLSRQTTPDGVAQLFQGDAPRCARHAL